MNEGESWFDTLLYWAANLFLWFVYLMLFLMAVSLTYAVLVSRRWITWVALPVFVLGYTIIFGRFWNYDYTFIAFAIMFVCAKLYLSLSTTKQKSQ